MAMSGPGHSQQDFPQPTPSKFFQVFSPHNLVTIYTTIRILEAMRKQLGLEAMLEYIEKYLTLIEKDNPQLQTAVTQALTLMKVERLYRDTVRGNEQ
jgi:hypothetical protein